MEISRQVQFGMGMGMGIWKKNGENNPDGNGNEC